MRARPGLRGFPPLPRRVPMRRVRAEDPAVPRAGSTPREGSAGSTAPRDDDLCLVHRAIIPAWPCGVDAGYDAWTKDRLAPKARCSWCLDVRRHALEARDSFAPAATAVAATAASPAVSSSSRTGRSSRWSSESFSCGGCARRTVRCETCERSLAEAPRARGRIHAFAKAGDDRCARCLARRVRLERARGRQRATDQDRTRVVRVVRRAVRAPGEGQGARQVPVPGVRRGIRRRARGARDRCERERPVVVSSVASSVTRRGSSTHSTSVGTCLRCEVIRATPSDEEASAVWETVRMRRAAADAAAVRVRDVLARKTRWSKAAHDAGAWRPFALLATLPPRERVRIASRLGIRLCRERGYLDPHAEAWRVLATPGKGILARADAAGGGGGGGGGGALGGLGRRVSASRGPKMTTHPPENDRLGAPPHRSRHLAGGGAAIRGGTRPPTRQLARGARVGPRRRRGDRPVPRARPEGGCVVTRRRERAEGRGEDLAHAEGARGGEVRGVRARDGRRGAARQALASPTAGDRLVKVAPHARGARDPFKEERRGLPADGGRGGACGVRGEPVGERY